MCEYGDAQWIDELLRQNYESERPTCYVPKGDKTINLSQNQNSTVNLHSYSIHILYSRFPQKRKDGKPPDGLCY